MKTTWEKLPAAQQPEWPDPHALEQVLGLIRELPSLVTVPEVHRLSQALARAESGELFVLQGGDCAESFAECTSARLTSQLKILLQMSLLLVHGRRQGVLRIARIGGQYAKPRSAPTETKDGLTLPSYRGDNVNAPAFTASARRPDPQRLLRGHFLAGMTMNHLRGLIDGGFADLRHPQSWSFDWMQGSPQAQTYSARVREVQDAIAFMEGLTHQRSSDLERIDFYASHEALLLPYEAAQVQSMDGRAYLLSTHLPWIGVRTAALDGAHVRFFEGVANPIGIKVGPQMDAEWVVELCRRLNPDNQAGKIVLIHRFGANHVDAKLPALVRAVQAAKCKALWVCDPMHGNTIATDNGYKTRPFDDILAEIRSSFAIHSDCESHLGGVHLELTGDNVTECIGGARDLQSADLERAYLSRVDPRLNAEQALELALNMVKTP
nr:3-deoxy-7-phosphoheptulonate synthase [Oceanococcus sp. HetDA_MAG_MS8]